MNNYELILALVVFIITILPVAFFTLVLSIILPVIPIVGSVLFFAICLYAFLSSGKR